MLGEYAFLCMSLAVITLTLSKSKFFLDLRAFLSVRAPFLYELISCPYCLMHWLSFIAVNFFSWFYWKNVGAIKFFLLLFGTIWISMILTGILSFAIRTAAKPFSHQEEK